jgi:hypothetical protein
MPTWKHYWLFFGMENVLKELRETLFDLFMEK